METNWKNNLLQYLFTLQTSYIFSKKNPKLRFRISGNMMARNPAILVHFGLSDYPTTHTAARHRVMDRVCEGQAGEIISPK